MIAPEYTLDTAAFDALLRHFSVVARKEFPELVKQTARTLARELGSDTAPFGLTKKAHEAGKTTIRNDIHRVYLTPAEIYEHLKNSARARKGSNTPPEQIASALYAALLNGNTAEARDILASSALDQRGKWSSIAIGPFDKGAAHQRASRKKGRIPKDAPPAMILTNSRGLNAYISQQQKKVGTAKGAWGDVSAKLGSSRGFPAWAMRAGAGKGTVSQTGSNVSTTIRIGTKLRYATDVLAENEFRTAQHRAIGKMKKMIEIALGRRPRK